MSKFFEKIPKPFSGLRLDQALSKIFPTYSRSRLKEWLLSDRIKVDGITRKPSDLVKGGEQIELLPELKEEGDVRDLIRQIQDLRKKEGLVPQDKIKVYFSDEKLKSLIEKYKEQIKKAVIAEEILHKKEVENIEIEKITCDE